MTGLSTSGAQGDPQEVQEVAQVVAAGDDQADGDDQAREGRAQGRSHEGALARVGEEDARRGEYRRDTGIQLPRTPRATVPSETPIAPRPLPVRARTTAVSAADPGQVPGRLDERIDRQECVTQDEESGGGPGSARSPSYSRPAEKTAVTVSAQNQRRARVA
ncbi:hypothetical protein [Streptomyces sp. NPDC004266]|uniref:hypothetical protein n=1 Tax=Streptomyces sp. NPDC004266 TaxID=3364693 RepID=UPI0036BDC0EA